MDAGDLVLAKAELADLWGQIDRVAVTTMLLLVAGEVAEREGLRGYDAVHLAAAIQVKATVLRR